MTVFSIELTVEKNQTEGGRLEHIALLQILKKARLAFLEKHQMSEDCIVPGIGFVIGELNVRYLGSAKANDLLNISLDVSGISEKSCALLYKVKKLPENKVIAAGKTTVVFLDTKSLRSVKIPDKFLEIVTKDPEPAPAFRISRL
jgi:acyl-CoA thioesterase FadM